MNNKYLRSIELDQIQSKTLRYFLRIIPNQVSMHIPSRNVYHESISRNSLYKNIFGMKLNYNNTESPNSLYVLFDYSSNSGVSDDIMSLGLGYEFLSKSNNINFNAGIKNLNSLTGFSYGVEYTRFRKFDFTLSLSNVSTPWNDNYTILSFKYAFNKK